MYKRRGAGHINERGREEKEVDPEKDQLGAREKNARTMGVVERTENKGRKEQVFIFSPAGRRIRGGNGR